MKLTMDNGAHMAFFHHSRTENARPEEFEKHCHNQYELLYIAEGYGTVMVEASEYPMACGTLFLFRPFEYHYVCPKTEAPYERYVVNFDRSILLPPASESPLLLPDGAGTVFGTDTLPVYRALSMMDYMEGLKEPEQVTFLRSMLSQIILLLGSAAAGSEPPVNNDLMGQILAYLNSHLYEALTLEEIARRFYISKYYLCRIFRRYTGVSVLNYIHAKRIANAQELMASGSSAAEAAQTVGYGEYSSFFRACIRSTGHSPVRNRK